MLVTDSDRLKTTWSEVLDRIPSQARDQFREKPSSEDLAAARDRVLARMEQLDSGDASAAAASADVLADALLYHAQRLRDLRASWTREAALDALLAQL